MKNAELMHDLRMPLQLMMSCAQLLELEIGENKRAQGYLHMLLNNAAEMQRMLTDQLEDLHSDSQSSDFVRSDLVQRTWDIYTRCQLYAGRKGIKLSFHSNVAHLDLALDEDKYRRILFNLISNALKFTPENGKVRIIVRALGDYVEIDVADNGCGIDADRLNSIFDLHETDGGYGYGLYIARKYASEMGGTVRATSAPGNGSVFTIRLPVRSITSAQQKQPFSAASM